jgi:hypothetical protein
MALALPTKWMVSQWGFRREEDRLSFNCGWYDNKVPMVLVPHFIAPTINIRGPQIDASLYWEYTKTSSLSLSLSVCVCVCVSILALE